jgi:hypothetical protein
VGAEADCELIGPGLLAQPVNSLTTIAFLIAGVVILARRPQRMWVGLAAMATGIGSFLFHGPMPPGSEWLHDVTLAWLLLVVATDHLPRRNRWAVLGLVGLSALFALAPAAADPVGVAVALVAIVSALRQDRSPATIGPLLLLAAAAIVGRLGATGGPLCDPGSLLQPHGLWHVAAPVAVAWWAIAAPSITRN